MRLAILNNFPPFFVDPATGLPPSNERECAALLWLFHQKNAVNWKAVRLYREDLNDSGLTAAALLEKGKALCLEYPLFSTDRIGGHDSAHNHEGDRQ